MTQISFVTIINVASVAVESDSFLLVKFLPFLARNAERRMKDAWSYGTNVYAILAFCSPVVYVQLVVF